MNAGQDSRPDASMTLLTEMMRRPLDPSYAAAAESREKSGLPRATSHHSPLMVIVALVIGGLFGISALALRAPATSGSQIKSSLVERIEASRAHADTQTRLIENVRGEINAAQAAALSQQSQTGLADELARLELAAGSVSVTGPGLELTIDDAPARVDPKNSDVDPRTATATDKGKVIAKDLQILVNGLWQAGAEAVSVNGHRLTARAAIRFAGEAILVDNRPLVRPYVITAIGDPGSLAVEFADNEGGSYLQYLKTNVNIRGDIRTRDSVVVPGEPALSLQEARPLRSAVTKKTQATSGASAPSTSSSPTTETSP